MLDILIRINFKEELCWVTPKSEAGGAFMNKFQEDRGQWANGAFKAPSSLTENITEQALGEGLTVRLQRL